MTLRDMDWILKLHLNLIKGETLRADYKNCIEHSAYIKGLHDAHKILKQILPRFINEN